MRGIRNIHNLECDMGVEYIHYLLDAGYAGGTVGRRRCAIRKMSFSLFGEFWPLPSVPHSPPRPEKVYAPGEVETLLNDMYGRTRHACVPDVVRFQFVTAARIREAVWVQTEDIEPQSGLVRLDKGTKGGRPRLIQVDPEHRPFLRDLKNKAIANADGYVFQKRNPLPGRVYSAVRYACKRTGIVCQGTHGFRKRAARDRLARCLNQGMSEAEAYQALALHLGHYRTSILVHYFPDYKE
jgi:integrase